jgi:hypothetical protein
MGRGGGARALPPPPSFPRLGPLAVARFPFATGRPIPVDPLPNRQANSSWAKNVDLGCRDALLWPGHGEGARPGGSGYLPGRCSLLCSRFAAPNCSIRLPRKKEGLPSRSKKCDG